MSRMFWAIRFWRISLDSRLGRLFSIATCIKVLQELVQVALFRIPLSRFIQMSVAPIKLFG